MRISVPYGNGNTQKRYGAFRAKPEHNIVRLTGRRKRKRPEKFYKQEINIRILWHNKFCRQHNPDKGSVNGKFFYYHYLESIQPDFTLDAHLYLQCVTSSERDGSMRHCESQQQHDVLSSTTHSIQCTNDISASFARFLIPTTNITSRRFSNKLHGGIPMCVYVRCEYSYVCVQISLAALCRQVWISHYGTAQSQHVVYLSDHNLKFYKAHTAIYSLQRCEHQHKYNSSNMHISCSNMHIHMRMSKSCFLSAHCKQKFRLLKVNNELAGLDMMNFLAMFQGEYS